MVSVFTPNIQIEEPARGDDVGTWDTPVNANMTLLDLTLGGITTISGAAGSVTLAAAQYRCKTITINSTLIASIQIAFPSSFIKSYEIQNLCTGSSAFTVNLAVNGSSGQQVCCPPGEISEIVNDGTNIKFKNLGRIGAYMDYAGSSVPNWVSGCTVPPYLNCDGTVFSSATYPALAGLIGTTLPDRRGTTGYTLNQGTARLTTASGGLDGNTNFSLKTTQITLSTSNLPAYTPSGTNAAPTFPGSLVTGAVGGVTNGIVLGAQTGGNNLTGILAPVAGAFTGNAQGGVSAAVPVGSATVYGLCLIRAG